MACATRLRYRLCYVLRSFFTYYLWSLSEVSLMEYFTETMLSEPASIFHADLQSQQADYCVSEKHSLGGSPVFRNWINYL